MFNYRLMSTLALSILLSHASAVSAASRADLGPTLDIRYGRHNDFQRVVVEGPHDFITKGKAEHKGDRVRVTFSGKYFTVKNRELPMKYWRDKNVLIFQQEHINSIKLRSLSDPSRMVIDFYSVKEDAEPNRKANAGPEAVELKSEKEKKPHDPSAKHAASGKSEHAGIEKKKSVKKKITPINPDKKEQKNIAHSDIVEETVTKKETGKAPEKPVTAVKQHATVIQEEKNEIKKENTDFVPDHYKKLWTLLETGNYYGLLTALPEYKPEDAGSVAVYHYMYGAASFGARQYMNAVKHLRLAYISSTSPVLKEMALSLRAKTYLTMKHYHEARADYKILIDTFPLSSNIREAHLGHADSLSKLGLYRKAVHAYEKAGSSAVALYSRANALQRLERVKEAEEMYRKAELADDTYPDMSPETYYLLGENMRMSGDLKRAKEHMSRIVSGPYRDNAHISMGLISRKEKKINEAIRHFTEASGAKDRKIKISGLFNLALTYLTVGNIKEATDNLEKLRHDHIDSYIYKDTLLALAKIYRKESQTKKSLSLLKELVYGKRPPQDAFNELEKIIIDSLDMTDEEDTGRMNIADIWKEVGPWLVDEKREAFLVQVSERLRNYGMPFIDLSGWLIKNASQGSRGRVALNLADYYAGIGEMNMANMYITMAMNKQLPSDDLLRVEVKILHGTGKLEKAMDRLVRIEHIKTEDVLMLGHILSDIHDPASETLRRGIDFYKEVLNNDDWGADTYISLGDILDASGRRTEAVKYYRIAHKKDPDDEWTIYRIGRSTGREESEKMYTMLQGGDSLLSRVAETELTGIHILNKVNEVY